MYGTRSRKPNEKHREDVAALGHNMEAVGHTFLEGQRRTQVWDWRSDGLSCGTMERVFVDGCSKIDEIIIVGGVDVSGNSTMYGRLLFLDLDLVMSFRRRWVREASRYQL